MPEHTSHPVFARVYAKVAGAAERRGGAERPRKLFRVTAAIERAGFQIETCERFPFSPSPLLPADPHILGMARRP